MENVKVILQNPTGLHARPASIFVKEAMKYESILTVRVGEKSADPKNIMGILILGAETGDELEISAEGPDEAQAVKSLKALIDSNFNV